ncbi:MAG TPA: glycosyltransferase family 39 protein, partial [Aggregatilineales bacterium]|nr:glycosyltransferase family 39 protein [Aggregatilineales bacterium]
SNATTKTARQNQWRGATLILLGFFLVAGVWLNKPFTGHHDWDTALYGYAVQHYLADGYSASDYVQVYSSVAEKPENWWYYRNNPPTIAILESLLVRATVYSEMFIRLPTVFITLFSLSVYYVFVRRLYGPRVGIRAMFFFALTPMAIYFSRTVNHEAFSILMVISLLTFYMQWMREHRLWQFLVCCLLAFAGLWVGHYMAFFLVVLFLYSLIFGTRYEQLYTFVIGLSGLLGMVSWFYFTTGGFDSVLFREMMDQFVYRSSSQGATHTTDTGFSLLQYAGRFGVRLIYLASPFFVFFAVAGMIAVYRKPHKTREEYLPAALFVAAFFYTTVFRNATYLHDYFMYYFIPPLSIWAGYGLHRLWQ